MKLSMRNTLSAAIVFLLTISMNAQVLKGPIKVTKGTNLNYAAVVKMDITQTMAGQEMKVKMNVTSTLKNVINNVLTNGNIDMTSSTWDIKTSTNAPGVTDTLKTLDGKVGPSIKMLISPNGVVLSKEKTDTINTTLPEAGNFSMDNKLYNTGVFLELPEKEIKKGDKWNKDINDSMAIAIGKMGVNSHTEYTFTGTEMKDGKNLLKVTYTTSMELGGKSKMMGMDFFIEGKGEGAGTMYLDPVSKVVSETSTDVEMEMTIAVTGQQDMTIPMTMKIGVTQKLLQ